MAQPHVDFLIGRWKYGFQAATVSQQNPLAKVGILGESERKIPEAYLKEERPEEYTLLLTRISQNGDKSIIEV